MSRIDEKLISPFVEATCNVLETMAMVTAEPGKPFIKKDEVAMGDVSGIMGFAGERMGTLSVSFSEKSILPVVSSMVGADLQEMDDDIKDAVGEITNMIAGQARRLLEPLGIRLHGGIPTVIMGKNHSISPTTDSPVVAVSFETSKGGFTIEVCIEQ